MVENSDDAGFMRVVRLRTWRRVLSTVYLRPGDPAGEADQWSVGVITDRQSERVFLGRVDAARSEQVEVTGVYDGSVHRSKWSQHDGLRAGGSDRERTSRTD